MAAVRSRNQRQRSRSRKWKDQQHAQRHPQNQSRQSHRPSHPQDRPQNWKEASARDDPPTPARPRRNRSRHAPARKTRALAPPASQPHRAPDPAPAPLPAAPAATVAPAEDVSAATRVPYWEIPVPFSTDLSPEEFYSHPEFRRTLSKQLGFCYLDPSELAFWHSGNGEAQKRVLSHRRRARSRYPQNKKMADPFEVRMRFSSQLQHLNASVVSAQKAAQYAVKYRDLCEDLHSCILEQLEKTNMNTRANIMYFIEHFVETASKDRHTETYVRMMQRDIIRVVDAVCPEDGSGAANVKVVRTVLQNLNSKGFLLDQTLTELEECLKERDTTHAEVGLSSPVSGDNPANDQQAANGSGPVAAPVAESDPRAGNNGTGTTRLEKRQIEQRIEEDRERHKKRRENMWVVPRSRSEERRKVWEETSDLNEDDWRQEREERERFMAQIEDVKCPHMRASRNEAPRDPANGSTQDRMDVDASQD